MEIHTDNLFELSIHSTRLQHNFQLIAALLKELQQQVASLARKQSTLTDSIAHNQQEIQWVVNRTQEHHTLIYQHHHWMEQLNAQFGIRQISTLPPLQERAVGEVAPVGEMPNRRLSEPTGNSLIPPSRIPQKNGLHQMLSNIKQRLRILQRESQKKDAQIEQLSRLLPKAVVHGEHKQKRVSIVSKEFTSKNKLSKRELKQTHLRLQLKEGTGEQQSENCLFVNNEKMIPAQSASEEEMGQGEDKLEVVLRLSRDLERVKEAMGEKNRILESHMKENHQKMQSLERSMDILERSHDMLKYDFQRTSTSFTKTSHDPLRRHEDRLNDTRVTNKEYYEDKLVELFNDMEFLKSEYFELQAKLEKEVQDEPEQDKNSRKARIGQKLMGCQRGSEESVRGEVMAQREEVRRLREEFQQFALGVNTGSSQVKTILIKPNQNKEDWKSLTLKMQKLRMEVNSAIRELEGKIVASNEMVVEFNQTGVAIEECKLLLKRKVEQAEFEKSSKRLQAKLNHFMMQVFEKQGQEGEFDGAIAKQPWFCLSCDSELKNYTGKVQKGTVHVEKLVGRKVNTESHMVRRNQNGRLPSVVK